MMKNRIPLIGVLVALAFVLSYVESLIPFSFGLPGIKIGLANIVTIIALFQLKKIDAFFIMLARVFLAGFTFGTMSSLLYSLAGGLVSIGCMILIMKTNQFSPIGISVIGGITHNIGQIIVAIFYLQALQLLYYLPFLLISGTIAGIFTGLLGNIINKRIQPLKITKKEELNYDNEIS